MSCGSTVRITRGFVAAATLCALCGPSWTTAHAQTTAGVNAGIQFDFSRPGARSLGMAGAFVGVADDATAAQSNPAGLVNLSKPEISVEGRTWNYYSSLPLRGHAFGSPTNVGVDT